MNTSTLFFIYLLLYSAIIFIVYRQLKSPNTNFYEFSNAQRAEFRDKSKIFVKSFGVRLQNLKRRIVERLEKRFFSNDKYEYREKEGKINLFYHLQGDTSKNIKYSEFKCEGYFYFIVAVVITCTVWLIIGRILTPIFVTAFIAEWLVFIILRYQIISYKISMHYRRLDSSFIPFFRFQYELLKNNVNKGFETGLRLYGGITENPTMRQFIQYALFLIRTEGEINAVNKLQQEYAPVTNINNLLNVERQLMEDSVNLQEELQALYESVISQIKIKRDSLVDRIITESNTIVWVIIFIVMQVCLGLALYIGYRTGFIH